MSSKEHSKDKEHRHHDHHHSHGDNKDGHKRHHSRSSSSSSSSANSTQQPAITLTPASGLPPLPAGWEERVDPKTGRTYFLNKAAKITQWARPMPGQQLPSKPLVMSNTPGEVLFLYCDSF